MGDAKMVSGSVDGLVRPHNDVANFQPAKIVRETPQMKIAFLTHQFPGVRGGGIGTYVVEAARALAAAGHEPHIFTFSLPGDAEKIRAAHSAAGIQLHEVPDLAARAQAGTLPAALADAINDGGEGIYRLALGWLLCEAVRDFHRAHGLDVVEAPEYEALGLPLMLQPEGEGTAVLPMVTHLHLCSAIARAGNAAQYAPTADDALIDALETASIRFADGICAPTRYIVAETIRYLGITPNAEIIPYPMQLSVAATSLPDNGTIVFVGRLEPRKGSALMAPAFNRFLSRNLDATIRLVGSDTQFAGIGGKSESVRAALVAALQPELRPRVHFAGEQPPEIVRAEFAACRFSIVPSLFDNFPYTAVESLAAGRPVVCGDCTGTVEVVGDGGLSFSRGDAGAFADAMEKLWRDRDLCQQLARQAAVRATELFSAKNTISTRINFYQRVIARVRSAASRNADIPPAVSDARGFDALLKSLSHVVGTPPETCPSGTNTPGTRLLTLMEKIAPTGARVHLYGAGRHTARLMAQRHLWESRGHRVIGIIDDHPRFATAPMHLGLPVQSIQAAVATLAPGDHVVLSTDTFEDQFWAQTETLRAKGINVYRLYRSI